MMQRIGLAQAMVHDPDLILLDEPTDGVDPMGRREIRDVLFQLKRRGKTIFLNSHLLSELEMVCDRVAILVGGQVATAGTLDELALARQFYSIELADVPTPAALSVVQAGAPTITLELREKTIHLNTFDAAAVQPVIDLLRAQQQIIRRVTPVRPSLEDLFVEAVGGGAGKSVEVGARSTGAA
jgi:ABC-2 type transport system ATP-binding protein